MRRNSEVAFKKKDHLLNGAVVDNLKVINTQSTSYPHKNRTYPHNLNLFNLLLLW